MQQLHSSALVHTFKSSSEYLAGEYVNIFVVIAIEFPIVRMSNFYI